MLLIVDWEEKQQSSYSSLFTIILTGPALPIRAVSGWPVPSVNGFSFLNPDWTDRKNIYPPADVAQVAIFVPHQSANSKVAAFRYPTRHRYIHSISPEFLLPPLLHDTRSLAIYSCSHLPDYHRLLPTPGASRTDEIGVIASTLIAEVWSAADPRYVEFS